MGRVSIAHSAIDTAETDVLVIGGGIAGWRAALAARQAGRRVIIAHAAQGASPFVLGVNAALGHEDPRDTPAVFVEDMIRGGYGLNDRPLVEALAEGGTAAVAELAELGVPFATHGGGRFRQRHLSGNTYARSLYVPEGTGRLILERLVAAALAAGVERLSGWRALALLGDDGVAGALLCEKRTDRLLAVGAGAVVLAAGGIGRIYADSTYPADVASDAPALALEAGARLIDMEFVQFEPTVTVHPAGCASMEMPTAMLGDGAQLRNAAGERFMFRCNPEYGEKRIEKARLALCIQREIDEGRGFPDGSVAFDTTVLAPETLETYVGHCRRLRAAGLDPAREAPRVRPAAHSAMGGVRVDAACRSDVPHLYVCGEAAGGIHGASRLAGNGGGEIVVFGAIAGRTAAAEASPRPRDPARSARASLALLLETARRAPTDLNEIAVLMSRCCGLYRDEVGLTRTVETLRGLRRSMLDGAAAGTVFELARNRSVGNALLGSALIAQAALQREESRGAHQRTDFPTMDDARWRIHIAAARGRDGEAVRSLLEIA